MKPTLAEYFKSVVISVWFVFALLLCVIILVVGLLISFGTLRDKLVAWLGFFLGRSTLWVAGIRFRLKYVGPVPNQPAVFIMNHSSTLDLFIVISMWLPNIRFVAKRELLYNPLFFIAGKLTDHIFIDRKNSQKSIEMLNKAIEKIRKNRLSVFFAPEGTRKHEGVIGKFKHGAFYMAYDLGYPIVPIYVEGTRELCPGNSLVTRKGTVTAYIHPPIDLSVYKKNEIPELVKSIRRQYMDWAGINDENENHRLDPRKAETDAHQ